jgi:hypothetical protein
MPPRVLLSSIRLLGKSPCPRCLIKKVEISEVGTPQDLERRQDLRFDDKDRKRRIEKARRLMFAKGVPVTSKKIEELLSEKSLVSTRVHTNYRVHALSGTDDFPLECLLKKARTN